MMNHINSALIIYPTIVNEVKYLSKRIIGTASFKSVLVDLSREINSLEIFSYQTFRITVKCSLENIRIA